MGTEKLFRGEKQGTTRTYGIEYNNTSHSIAHILRCIITILFCNYLCDNRGNSTRIKKYRFFDFVTCKPINLVL